MYDYKQGFDILQEYYKDFIAFCFWKYGLKPKYQYSKKSQRLYMTLYGYSIEEKAKNKTMILNAMHDYIKEEIEKPF